MGRKWLDVLIRILFWLFVFLGFLLGLQFIVHGQDIQIPPDVLMVNDLSCVLHQHKTKWQATCTASYLNHDSAPHREPWQAPPFPERNSEVRANKDADQWIKRVLKIQAATKPVNVNDLKKENKT